jgi:Sec-independent protein translocase protein TatA
MKLLGLNSPEIFIILIILLSILGTKRIEKGFLLFKKLLKYLLSKEENQTLENSEVKSEEPEESEVKEETIDAEVKSVKPKKKSVKDK